MLRRKKERFRERKIKQGRERESGRGREKATGQGGREEALSVSSPEGGGDRERY